MNSATPAIRNLAKRLLSLEAQSLPDGERIQDAVRACEKLRVPLAKLAGVAGFRSLMTRAKVLATAEVPWLDSVLIRVDGSLEGFDEAKSQPGAAGHGDAGVVVVAQLLGLLTTFIGEPLTLRLVRDVWPDVSLVGMDAVSGERS